MRSTSHRFCPQYNIGSEALKLTLNVPNTSLPGTYILNVNWYSNTFEYFEKSVKLPFGDGIWQKLSPNLRCRAPFQARIVAHLPYFQPQSRAPKGLGMPFFNLRAYFPPLFLKGYQFRPPTYIIERHPREICYAFHRAGLSAHGILSEFHSTSRWPFFVRVRISH